MEVVAVVGSTRSQTSERLVAEWQALGLPALLLSGHEARATLGADDVALGRLDVLPSVDGVEPGLLDLLLLERRGVPVLNRAFGLLAVHDKLRTATLLERAGVPHPRTGLVRAPGDPLPVQPPLVVKPRFGSWGVDVHRCATVCEARDCLRRLAGRSWFARHGALVQELVPPRGTDLRVLVAGGRALGAIHRIAQRGEWRTNVALGGQVETTTPSAGGRALAEAAARASGCDLVAVDLLPLPGGGYLVLELNGAADFDERYAPPGRDVYRDTATALDLLPQQRARESAAKATGA
jgi:RimK family alpha-L-glutamate ligase